MCLEAANSIALKKEVTLVLRNSQDGRGAFETLGVPKTCRH